MLLDLDARVLVWGDETSHKALHKVQSPTSVNTQMCICMLWILIYENTGHTVTLRACWNWSQKPELSSLAFPLVTVKGVTSR